MKVYIVGSGIGKADLITVRGANVLAQADVVIHDYLTEPEILSYAKPDAELISCGDLDKKRGIGTHQTKVSQEKINGLMVAKSKEGKKVVRLKNGDVSIFSRLNEELGALYSNNIDFEVIPAVTSAGAACAYTGVSLTDRELASSVIFVTGHENSDKTNGADWEKISFLPTIVLYMAVGSVANIASKLISCGKSVDTPVLCISNIASIKQKLVKGVLSNIAYKIKDNAIEPPAIFIIGEVVGFEDKFNWFRKSKKILFTGLSDERFFLDGLYFHLPLIKIIPIDNYDEFDSHLKRLSIFDWLVFTSRYGVDFFFKRLSYIGFDSRALAGLKIAVIGQSTASALRQYGIFHDVMPEVESSSGLINVFGGIDIAGKKIFIPRSDLSDKGLTTALSGCGAEVTASVAYKNVMPDNLPDIDLNMFDEIHFTSPSTVRNFISRYKSAPVSCKIKCIGGVTLNEAKKWKIVD